MPDYPNKPLYLQHLVNNTCKCQPSTPNLMGARKFYICGVSGVPKPLQTVSKSPNVLLLTSVSL